MYNEKFISTSEMSLLGNTIDIIKPTKENRNATKKRTIIGFNLMLFLIKYLNDYKNWLNNIAA